MSGQMLKRNFTGEIATAAGWGRTAAGKFPKLFQIQ